MYMSQGMKDLNLFRTPFELGTHIGNTALLEHMHDSYPSFIGIKETLTKEEAIAWNESVHLLKEYVKNENKKIKEYEKENETLPKEERWKTRTNYNSVY